MPKNIQRDDWVETFTEGFGIGARERKRQPDDRRQDVTDVIDASEYTDPELDALQAGYDVGRKEAFPGADIDTEQRANTAYDRSEYSAGLDQWAGGSNA